MAFLLTYEFKRCTEAEEIYSIFLKRHQFFINFINPIEYINAKLLSGVTKISIQLKKENDL